ncbi:hypothetical protein BDR05DRAFT_953498 [Suillus weaverae]|nr:hypothetical protein BDR05DRAFT_953498 [Suillus weaverae]
MYDADRLSPLDSDINHVAMMRGNSCLGAPFVVVNGMTVIPNRVDELVNGLELSPSCMEDDSEWYHISQAVVAAASAASELEHTAAESQSSALATAMDTYLNFLVEQISEVLVFLASTIGTLFIPLADIRVPRSYYSDPPSKTNFAVYDPDLSDLLVPQQHHGQA